MCMIWWDWLTHTYICDAITTIKLMNITVISRKRKDYIQIRSHPGLVSIGTSTYNFGGWGHNSTHNAGKNHLKWRSRIQWFNIWQHSKKRLLTSFHLFKWQRINIKGQVQTKTFIHNTGKVYRLTELKNRYSFNITSYYFGGNKVCFLVLCLLLDAWHDESTFNWKLQERKHRTDSYLPSYSLRSQVFKDSKI